MSSVSQSSTQKLPSNTSYFETMYNKRFRDHTKGLWEVPQQEEGAKGYNLIEGIKYGE
jgi:hypothetical protein